MEVDNKKGRDVLDISKMDVTQTNTKTGIKIGNDHAPVKVIEFINLRCPYCRQWFNDSEATFAEYVANGKVQRVIKLFDKTKPSLAKGNIMHKYVPKEGQEDTLDVIAKIYDTQDIWGELEDHEEIANYAENTLGLLIADDITSSKAIIEEADNAQIIFVPTMVVGQHIFDQKISQEEFRTILDKA